MKRAVTMAVVAASLAIAVGLIGAAGAAALPLHGLGERDCIADIGAPGCTANAQGLGGAVQVAVSPDGNNVYATSGSASGGENAIVTFDRAPNGVLSNPSCIDDVGGAATCGAGNEAQGLDGAAAIAVSPDGASVYVVSFDDDAIVRFDRAPNGDLSNPSCIADVGVAGCASTAQGLNSAFKLAVSPDGVSVYVGSQNDNAVVRFDRAPSGALSNPSCIEDTGGMAGCGVFAAGLNIVQGIAVSPDGASVYATGTFDNAIVRFNRAPSGALSSPSCIADVGTGGCGSTAQGLNRPTTVAVSPDGASVYVSSFVDNAVVRFDRALGGALTNAGCIEDAGGAAGCGAFAQGLSFANGLTVSNDGASVYVLGGSDDALVRFDRAASNGALVNPSCIAETGDVAGCGVTAANLASAGPVAVSPDGASLYFPNGAEDMIVRFSREVAPVCRTSSSTGAPGAVQTISLDCLDPNDDPQTIFAAKQPSNGTLGSINQAARTVTYTPNGGFTGVDSFDIHATADGRFSNTAAVVVGVQTATGPQGPAGPQGPPGRDATVTCKSKGKKRIKCSVAFAAAPAVRSARLSRDGVIYAEGKPKLNSHGQLVLRFRRTSDLTAGSYTLTVVQRADGSKIVTKSRVRVS